MATREATHKARGMARHSEEGKQAGKAVVGSVREVGGGKASVSVKGARGHLSKEMGNEGEGTAGAKALGWECVGVRGRGEWG